MTEVFSPQQLSMDGQSAYQRGDYLAAAEAYHAAVRGYEASGEILTAAEMRNNLSVVLNRAGDTQAALSAVDGTPAIFAGARDLRRQGIALGNLASALETLKRFPEAVQAYEQASDLLGQCGESDLRAHVLKSLSMLRLRSGRSLEALVTMQSGLESLPRPTIPQRILKRLMQILSRSLPK